MDHSRPLTCPKKVPHAPSLSLLIFEQHCAVFVFRLRWPSRRSWYIFIAPGCTVYLALWASSKIFCLKSRRFGTYTLPQNLRMPFRISKSKLLGWPCSFTHRRIRRLPPLASRISVSRSSQTDRPATRIDDPFGTTLTVIRLKASINSHSWAINSAISRHSPTQSVSHHIGTPRVIQDGAVVVLQELHPPSLPRA